MDVFCEYMVKKKKTFKDSLIVAGIIAAAVFLSLIVFFFLFGLLFGFEVFVVAGIIYGALIFIRRTDIEYEYILTNSVLDIDKIMSKKTRKRVISIDFKNIEICNHLSEENKNPSLKILDLSGDIDAKNVYHVDFTKDSTQYRVYIRPNAKMLSKLKLVSPRLVNVREEDLQ